MFGNPIEQGEHHFDGVENFGFPRLRSYYINSYQIFGSVFQDHWTFPQK